MPLTFCHVQASYGTRKACAPASKKLDYLTRKGSYSKDRDECLSVLAGNMPGWAGEHGRNFWKAVDAHERANAVLWRQIEFSLPNETTDGIFLDEAEKLAEQYARLIVGNDHPFTLAIHSGKGKQLHCHLIFSDRCNDGLDRTLETYFKKANLANPERGGAYKSQEKRDRDWILEIRSLYAETVNRWQVAHGYGATVDPRSYEDQGRYEIPTTHEGHGDKAEMIAAENEQIRERNSDIVRLAKIHTEVKKLEAELEAAARVPAPIPLPPPITFTGWLRGIWRAGKATVFALVDAAKNVMYGAYLTGSRPDPDIYQGGNVYQLSGQPRRLGSMAVVVADELAVVERRTPPAQVYDLRLPRPLGLPAPEIPEPRVLTNEGRKDHGQENGW